MRHHVSIVHGPKNKPTRFTRCQFKLGKEGEDVILWADETPEDEGANDGEEDGEEEENHREGEDDQENEEEDPGEEDDVA